MKTHHSLCILAFVGVFVCGIQARCDPPAMQQCMVPFQEYSSATKGGLMKPFNEEDLNSACGTFETVNTCVQNSMSSCDQAVKTVWEGIEDTFTYLCSDEGRAKIKEFNPCYETSGLQPAVVACNNTLTQETNRIKTGSHSSQEQLFSDLCRVSRTYVTCVTDTVERLCSEDAANWHAIVMKKVLQPAMSLMNCQLEGGEEDSSGGQSDRATAIQINTVLLLASLLIYLIKF